MKIDRIDTVQHEDFPNLLHVLVHTDDGVVGTGETFYGAEAVEAQIHAVAAPLLLGADPLRINAHNRTLQGYVGYTGSGAETRARSAIDIALWDIRARAAGVPLYDSLGGLTRSSIRTYNTCAGSHYVRRHGQSTRNWGLDAQSGNYEDLQRFLTDAGSLAEELLAEGLTGMKIWPFDSYAEASNGTSITAAELQRALSPIRQIRDAVGTEMDVMIELHALWNVPMARKIIRALADFQPYWVEDPVRADIDHGLASLTDTIAAAGTMLAAGETVASVGTFLPLIGSGGPLDVVTLDVTWCGGFTEAIAIAAVAATAGRAIAPHDCTGPISLAAATHLSLSAPNALLQETVRASLRGWYGDIATNLPTVAEGHLHPPTGTGLGTELQPDYLTSSGAHVRSSR
ncbi:mandelate racemase/muconate lactonizing enzyme family protein [Microlunatus panaciterrae]|uniref:L-alanine-DL-glutamate epimerase-like enolase superfamily enzyme n=1 Tax=Microlunatus panaciterrae TaxID=400768 RepID=A0ABS2RH29_9ACTN|nr:mandelate racemase/muconate lactonizing enzyme family protein [Microlunatus panaciterrae]MBM7797842.1 L-alanine-DL-glutamate epimerase-like enolase superfamily enzyme [Microlunatus panaciterrae]